MIYEFSPKQDLHGYDKPWAPGEGINQLPNPTAETVTYNGITIAVDDAGVYHISGTASPSFSIIDFSVEEYTIQSGDSIHVLNTATLTQMSFSLYFTDESHWEVTPSSLNRIITFGDDVIGKTTSSVRFYIASGYSYEGTISPMILQTSAVTPFSPYANICPPIGYDIWDPVSEQMIQVYSGYVDAEARKLYLHPVYEEYTGEELVGPWMSSMDEYTEEGTPTTGAFVVDFGGEVMEYDITDFMLQTLLDSLGVRRFISSGAMLLNSLMDQAQGRVRSEAELLNRSLPIHVIAIGKELPTNLVIKKPVSDVLPVLPGKTKFDRR